MKYRKDLDILLIQIREDQQVKDEELESFSHFSKLDLSQFSIWNVFDVNEFDPKMLEGIDLVFVGGSSAASVLETEKYPFVTEIQKALLQCLDNNIPVFASCFGFQAAILSMGGVITTHETNFEMGTYPISLTPRGKLDPVFKNTPDRFQAVSVHKEKATELPKSCELLAYTVSCVHGFKVKNKNFWAFQFHPEVDKRILVDRLRLYQSRYTEDPQHFEDVIQRAHEVPHANKLVANFVNLFCKDENN